MIDAMGKMHAEGVTLIELLVALSVMAIVLTLGIPAFTDFFASSRMSAASNDVVSAMHLARSEAIKRRRSVVVCASTNASSPNPACSGAANPGNGWLVFVDDDADATVDAGELILSVHGPLPESIQLNSAWGNGGDGAPFYAAFSETGLRLDLPAAGSRSLVDIQLCDDRGDRDLGGGLAAGRWVQLAATGRPQLYRERALIQGGGNPLGGC